MSTIRHEIANAALTRAHNLINFNIYDDIPKEHEFKKQTIFTDESLKAASIRILKIIFDEGTRRICENCSQERLATLYCEYCVRDHLKAKFSDWTSRIVWIFNKD